MKPLALVVALAVVVMACASFQPEASAAKRRALVASAPAPAPTPVVATWPIVHAPAQGLALPKGPRPSTVLTYGTRDFAGRTWLIVPAQAYPPTWEDACTRKQTYEYPGLAPWPGIQYTLGGADDTQVAPVGTPR